VKRHQKKKKFPETGCESREGKLEKYRYKYYYLLLVIGHAVLSSVSRTKRTAAVSRTDNFVNVFNSVTSPPVLSYHCVLSHFLTMSVGFHFNLTFGLKPEVGGIKIVSHCLQTIHFPS